MVRKSTGYRRKKRDARTRKVKRVLLIAAEGSSKNKTEKSYFHNFQNDLVTVRFVSGDETDPVHLANRLKHEAQEMELQEDDFAACIVDADFTVEKNVQLSRANTILKKVRNTRAELIVSNPCFKIWYLCHFVYSTRQFNNPREVLDELKKYIVGYEKNQNVYPEYLQDKTNKAIENAKKMEKHCLDSGHTPHTVAFSPSTDVYKIFEIFLSKYVK